MKLCKVFKGSYLNSPFTIIPTREHKASASSIECVVKIAPLVPWKLAKDNK